MKDFHVIAKTRRTFAALAVPVVLMLCVSGCSQANTQTSGTVAPSSKTSAASSVNSPSSEADGVIQATCDDQFLNALEDSILWRMENSDWEDYITLVNGELARLNEYRDAQFSDPIIAKAAGDYIGGLDKQKEALVGDASEYQVTWASGYIDRCTALVSLYNSHSFLSSNPDFVATYIMDYDEAVLEFDTITEIWEDLSYYLNNELSTILDIDFDFDMGEIEVELENGTSHSFDVIMEFHIKNSDGETLYVYEGYGEAYPNSEYSVYFDAPYLDDHLASMSKGRIVVLEVIL